MYLCVFNGIDGDFSLMIETKSCSIVKYAAYTVFWKQYTTQEWIKS